METAELMAVATLIGLTHIGAAGGGHTIMDRLYHRPGLEGRAYPRVIRLPIRLALSLRIRILRQDSSKDGGDRAGRQEEPRTLTSSTTKITPNHEILGMDRKVDQGISRMETTQVTPLTIHPRTATTNKVIKTMGAGGIMTEGMMIEIITEEVMDIEEMMTEGVHTIAGIIIQTIAGGMTGGHMIRALHKTGGEDTRVLDKGHHMVVEATAGWTRDVARL
ncbi:hypothetical protein ABW20_dc0100810 [Dactylellina cionopaga]|nr:hypothetical protein ABW20_dc0100810 [Dactylellina cionopaga]